MAGDVRPSRGSDFAREGAAGLRELTDTGEPFFVPLERIKTEHRIGGDTHRIYNIYRLPPEHGGGELRLRLTGNDEDDRRVLNRA
ncbi:MAG: hypothetical protein ACXWW9_06320 [Actinomycetota bacterium]